jgi:ribosomal protein L32
MKLLIKDEYFKEIKSGKKTIDYRDAHITFVNEATGEQIRKKVFYCRVKRRILLPKKIRDLPFFDDDNVICFHLEERPTRVPRSLDAQNPISTTVKCATCGEWTTNAAVCDYCQGLAPDFTTRKDRP